MAAHRIRHARDRALAYGVVLEEHALHLERADAVAAALDDVVVATHVPVVAVFVRPRGITRVVPAVVHRLGGALLVAEVLEQDAVGARVDLHDDLTRGARRALGAGFVLDLHAEVRRGLAHRARFGRHPDGVEHQ